MSGADIDYDFEQKNQWRNWQWNIMMEKMRGNFSEKLILYLAGPNALDREVAIKKGFSDYNLLGVDTSEENIKELRKRGGLGIVGNIKDVLKSWPHKYPKIDGLILDLCCGVNWKTMAMVVDLRWCQGIRLNSIVSVNCLRGRDGVPEYFDKAKTEKCIFKILNRRYGISNNKNRAAQLLCSWYIVTTGSKNKDLINSFFTAICPKFKTYRAKNGIAMMDSVIYNHHGSTSKANSIEIHPTRELSAWKAVRTMRMK